MRPHERHQLEQAGGRVGEGKGIKGSGASARLEGGPTCWVRGKQPWGWEKEKTSDLALPVQILTTARIAVGG
jgi:hypothetical protein